MTEQTPTLSLPIIMPAQAQKHVTHNEALERLDLLVQLTLESAAATAAPGTPAEGESWVVGNGATGPWSGQSGRIASWRGGGWIFVTPQDGWLAWCKDTVDLKVYSGGIWRQLAVPSP